MNKTITPEMKTRIGNVIEKTWSAIASDWCEIDPTPDYRSVCEATVDANRHQMYGDDSDASDVINKTDYKTLEKLVKTLNIV
jgi:hypothetical protein